MEVLFLILKIVGICFLVLLGIVLVLVLSVMFIPVRYRIRGKGETSGTMEADAVFSWVFHLLHYRIQYGEDGVQTKMRILGISINLNKKKKQKRKQKEKSDSSKARAAEETNIQEKQSIEEKQEIEKIEEKESIGEVEEKRNSEEVLRQSSEKEPDSSGKTSFRKKFSLKKKIGNIKKKIWKIKQQLGNIKSIISEETNRNAVAVLFQELKYLLKHYSPRKASGELQFSMGDPADTGQILGVISLFPFWYRYKISVTPDFMAENSYAEGTLFMKGYMRSVHLLVIGIRMMKNKDIRKFINQLRT